ncbi:MAG: amino acid adenylation domain-containing protein, partial [Deltaproteobacteria bacterium]|nr:amino acid adenylation domain-containing protein [Deltaproteobacteria bacterium]
IELGEIEAALHKRVKEAAVIVHGEGSDKQLVGYYVGDATPQALKDALKLELPEYMVPAILMQLQALPLTPNGKVDRKALPAPEATSDGEYVAPRNAAEELVAGAYAQVLGLKQPVGAHDDFFALGGHSLLATQLVSRLAKIFGKAVALKTLFEAPRVSELALWVEAAERTSLPALVAQARPERVPLSYAQQRLFFLYQLEPESVAYHITSAMRVRGALDVKAFERALNGVIARHESLRTTFRLTGGIAEQVVHEKLPVTIEQLDGAYQEKPFDFLRGPLVRCAVRPVRQNDTGQDDSGQAEHEVYLSMHHIVSDGWSLGVFWRELSALYNGEGLPPLAVQYADYALWQREHVKLDAQEAYWKQKLAGAPAALELPIDRPRPAVMSHRGAVHTFAIEKAETINTLSRTEGVTLYMTLLAAFDVLLARYSGQDDVVVGSPIANRQYEATEPIIGFFVNTLCMRTDSSGNPSFRALLKKVKETALEAYAHQDLPFEKLVEVLNPERSTARSPVFQVMFTLQNAPDASGDFSPGLRLEGLDGQEVQAKFDLTMTLCENEGRLEGVIEYATDLFDRETIERMVGHYQKLLSAIAKNPDEKIGALEMLGEAERQKLVVEWNATKRDYPRDQSIHALFLAQAKKTPDAVAVVFGEETLSYRALDERSNQLARYLQKHGVGKGGGGKGGVGPETLVAICVERSLDMVVGLLAILKAGGVYVPVDPRYPQARIAHILSDSRASIAVTTEALASLCAGIDPMALVTLDTLGKDIGKEATSPLKTRVDPKQLAYIIYTSGSTGGPKGVAIEHRNAVTLIHWAREEFSDEELSGVLAATSICFDLSVFELFVPLSWGGTVIVAENALALAQLPARERVTLVNTVPSAMTQLEATGAIPESVCAINLAGEALSDQLVQKLYGHAHIRRVRDLYGPSEDTTYSTAALRKKGNDSVVTIGRPIANTAVYLLSPELELVPQGANGEICIGGQGLARGYLHRPELTAEKFITHPVYGRLYRTGDLGRWLSSGELQYLGRRDNQVKVRGFRIELGEIEAALHKHVKEAVVIVHGEGS